MQMVEIRPSLFLPLYVKSVAKLGLTPCRVPGQAIERFVSSEQMTQSHLSLKGSNQMYSQRTWLLWPRLSLGLGDESDASKLRHGCKTVMINETSCLESTPVFNEEEAPENIDDALRIHASAEYIRLIGEQCVDRTSGYPACLSTNAAVDTSNETSNTNDDVNGAADNGVDETDESRSGADGQLEEVTRSSSASKKWRCILLAPVLLSFGL